MGKTSVGKRSLPRGKMLGYQIEATRLGWVGIAGSEEGLSYSTLPQSSPEQALALLRKCSGELAEGGFPCGDLPQRLRRYCEGRRVVFPDRLNLARATPFQRAVWEATRSIPYSQTRSYAWLARQVGKPKGSRAVGQALARNPLPIIIPCHRVIASTGQPGGFGGGLALKKRLLELEARGQIRLVVGGATPEKGAERLFQEKLLRRGIILVLELRQHCQGFLEHSFRYHKPAGQGRESQKRDGIPGLDHGRDPLTLEQVPPDLGGELIWSCCQVCPLHHLIDLAPTPAPGPPPQPG